MLTRSVGTSQLAKNVHAAVQGVPRIRRLHTCSPVLAAKGATTGLRTSAHGTVSWLVSLDRTPAVAQSGNTHEELVNLDAIIMLGGGQTRAGGVPSWAARRLDAAADLWAMQKKKQGCPVLCVGGGTPHKPSVLSQEGHVIHESTSCASYLLSKGLPAQAILKETSSFDTVGNAYFALSSHAIPAGWRSVAVVTSDFHMPRSRALFEDMWELAACDLFKEPGRFALWFAGVRDEDLFQEEIVQARRAKEAASLATWRASRTKLPSFAALHEWLHQTHLCYAVSRQHEFSKPTISDQRLLQSY